MAVHEKNLSFAEEQKLKIAESVKSASQISNNVVSEKKDEAASSFKTVTNESSASTTAKKKDVLIGIHVTKEEQTELRQMFCSNGFSLATAYRAAMTYLRQDIIDGKAIITNNGEILRK
ncbi:MAG: hypothetical protein MJ188_09250 [Treponema sp.]|nr:hypothetical protein [Treponema sp.]